MGNLKESSKKNEMMNCVDMANVTGFERATKANYTRKDKFLLVIQSSSEVNDYRDLQYDSG